MKTILAILLFLTPVMLQAQQETVSEKIESILSWIESDSSYKGAELKMILKGILEIATEEIQATAKETAEKTEKAVRDILVPVIEKERTEKNIWMVVGIASTAVAIVTTIILIVGGK